MKKSPCLQYVCCKLGFTWKYRYIPVYETVLFHTHWYVLEPVHTSTYWSTSTYQYVISTIVYTGILHRYLPVYTIVLFTYLYVLVCAMNNVASVFPLLSCGYVTHEYERMHLTCLLQRILHSKVKKYTISWKNRIWHNCLDSKFNGFQDTKFPT